MKKLNTLIQAALDLSLGLSMVVAVLIGFFLGLFLEKLTGLKFLFYFGLLLGILACILNVYKAYKRQVKMYDEFKKDK